MYDNEIQKDESIVMNVNVDVMNDEGINYQQILKLASFKKGCNHKIVVCIRQKRLLQAEISRLIIRK